MVAITAKPESSYTYTVQMEINAEQTVIRDSEFSFIFHESIRKLAYKDKMLTKEISGLFEGAGDIDEFFMSIKTDECYEVTTIVLESTTVKHCGIIIEEWKKNRKMRDHPVTQ